MRDPEKLKKSESLEVRLPHATKLAFMARCRSEGRSASEAVRDFIQVHLDGPSISPNSGRANANGPLRWIAGGVAALAFGAAAAPSLALPALTGEFARLDANRDDGISLDEFTKAAALQVAVRLDAAKGRPSTIERLGAVFSSGDADWGAIGPGARLDAGIRRSLVQELFERADLNHDGSLSFREFRRYRGR